jgi:hypothetical protein
MLAELLRVEPLCHSQAFQKLVTAVAPTPSVDEDCNTIEGIEAGTQDRLRKFFFDLALLTGIPNDK